LVFFFSNLAFHHSQKKIVVWQIWCGALLANPDSKIGATRKFRLQIWCYPQIQSLTILLLLAKSTPLQLWTDCPTTWKGAHRKSNTSFYEIHCHSKMPITIQELDASPQVYMVFHLSPGSRPLGSAC